MSDESFEKGMAVIADLFMPTGSEAPKQPPYPEEIAEDFARLSVSTVMGDVWGRPGLDKSKKAIVTIGALTVTGKTAQLKSYIAAALNLGVPREEICEVILHVSVYGGFPAAIEALGVAKEVFDARDAE